jgi:hypothetical protein
MTVEIYAVYKIGMRFDHVELGFGTPFGCWVRSMVPALGCLWESVLEYPLRSDGRCD